MIMPEEGNPTMDGKSPQPSPAKPNEYVCVHCSKAHKNQELLIEHLQTCTSENNNSSNGGGTPGKQNHMCMECGELLSTPYSLKRHLLTHTGVKPHKCEFCGKKYKHAYLLNHHLNTHAGDRPYQCTVCFKDFTSPNMLRRHKQVHSKQQHRCQYCEQQFQRIDYLDKHLATDHNVDRTHLCLICGKSFTFEAMLKEHISMHNKYADVPEENLKCNICSVKFSRISSLNRHKKQIHGINAEEKSHYFKNVTASDGDETIEEPNNEDVKENITNESTASTNKTNGDNSLFSGNESFMKQFESIEQSEKETEVPYQPVLSFPESKIVVQNKTVPRNYSCDKCGMEFTTSELLSKHEAVVHPDESKMQEELLRVIRERIEEERRKEHANASLPEMSVKTEVVTIDCPSCNTHFADAKSYENHLPICASSPVNEHDSTLDKPSNDPSDLETSPPIKDKPGGRPKKGRQKCPECGKMFADNYCLRRHMVSHTGEKNYTCEMCGKKFAHSFHLTNHRKIHLGIKDFGCEICGKSFTVKHALQRHFLTHPSAVSYQCALCPKKFATKASMQKHQLSHQLSQNDSVNQNVGADDLLEQSSIQS